MKYGVINQYSYIVLLLITALTVSGCSKSYTLNTVLLTAVYITPEGEFEMKLLANKETPLYRGEKEYRGYRTLHMHDSKYEVIFSPSPSRYDGGKIVILSLPSVASESSVIKFEESYYQFNNGPHTPLLIQGANRKGGRIHEARTKYVISEPRELARYDIDENGDGVISPERYKDELEDELYRYYIKFLINEESYELDVSFKFDIDTRYEFGFPVIVP